MTPYKVLEFLKEGVVEIKAAIVGVGKGRWISLRTVKSLMKAATIMRQNRFDVLPVVNGGDVKKIF